MWDVFTRKMPNWLVYGGTLAGVGLQWGLLGKQGLYRSLFAGAIGFCFMYILWQLNWVGGGEVKLLTLVGAFTYPSFVVYTGIYAVLVSGLIALAAMARQREVVATLKRIPTTLAGKRESAGKTPWMIPYAVPITAGVMLAQFMPKWF